MPQDTIPRIFCSSGVGGCVPICSGVHLGTQHSGDRDCEYSLCDWPLDCFLISHSSVIIISPSLCSLPCTVLVILSTSVYSWEREAPSNI